MLFFRSDRLYEAAAQSPEKAAALLVRLRKAWRSAILCTIGIPLLGFCAFAPVLGVLKSVWSPNPSPWLEWCLAHDKLILMAAGFIVLGTYLQLAIFIHLDGMVKMMILLQRSPREPEVVKVDRAH